MEDKEFSSMLYTILYLYKNKKYKGTFFIKYSGGSTNIKFSVNDEAFRIKVKDELKKIDGSDFLFEEELTKDNVKNILDKIKNGDIESDELGEFLNELNESDGTDRIASNILENRDKNKIIEELEDITDKKFILSVDEELELSRQAFDIFESLTDKICLDGEGKVTAPEDETPYEKDDFEIIGDIKLGEADEDSATEGENSFEKDCKLLKKHIRIEAKGESYIVVYKNTFKKKFSDLNGRLESGSEDVFKGKFEDILKKEKHTKGKSEVKIEGVPFNVHEIEDDEVDTSDTGTGLIDSYFNSGDGKKALFGLYKKVSKKIKFKENEAKFLKGFNDLFGKNIVNIKVEEVDLNGNLLIYFRKKFKEEVSKMIGKGEVFGEKISVQEDIKDILKKALKESGDKKISKSLANVILSDEKLKVEVNNKITGSEDKNYNINQIVTEYIKKDNKNILTRIKAVGRALVVLEDVNKDSMNKKIGKLNAVIKKFMSLGIKEIGEIEEIKK